ncbi:MAG: ABC transporter ATP-binding protein [Candidatus Omnitrophica bacterium]|nr:ABC transporter ATP-binding protein [Candidatus Omnitrophota bacterium]
MMPLIEVKNVSKTYVTGKNIETPALSDVNLWIGPGEFTAIAGPSGSGKSTLLHILGALDFPTAGAVIYNGRDIAALPPDEQSLFRRDVLGFVFQAYNLINTLTALENVEYIMLLKSVEPVERREKAVAMLKRVGLADYIHRFPNEMSGGQQQRVAVARAMAAEPDLVIADEPTANLDSKTALSLITLMDELNQEKKTTFLFATHDPLVMQKARRVIWLRDGKLIEPQTEI